MKNKKSLIAIAGILLIVVIGVTFAYFNSNATFQNRFNLGNYNVVTQEVFTSPDNWSPGDTIPKTLIATNNGSIDAAVRVSYIESWTDENGDEVDISDIPNNAVTIDFITPSQWTEDDGYYYYNYILKPGESTSSLIESVTLNPSLNDSSCVEENGVQTCTSNIQGLSGYHYTLTFTIETVQYDQYQTVWGTDFDITEKPLIELPAGRTASNLQVGDEICINGATKECFNFYGYDGNNLKLLAKWNLNVGAESKGTATNVQDIDVRGEFSEMPFYGSVPFSSSDYWLDGGGNLKSKYGSSYPADVYDNDYLTEPTFDYYGDGYDATGYSVAYYVENYKDILESYGVTINEARLLTYSEAIDNSIGCSGSSCPTNGFINNTSYWLGSADRDPNFSDGLVWHITYYGGFGLSFREGYYDGYVFGVRPVIVISKSEIQ